MREMNSESGGKRRSMCNIKLRKVSQPDQITIKSRNANSITRFLEQIYLVDIFKCQPADRFPMSLISSSPE